MKKLMFMLAAVACAATLQAACVVNWNTGTIYAPGTGGTGYDEGYATIADGTAGLLATLYVGTGYDGDTLTGLVNFSSGFTGSTVLAGSIANGTDAALADDTVYYGQLVITYGDSQLVSQIVKFETSAMSGSADPYFGDGGMMIEAVGSNVLDPMYGAFPATGWTGAPEPTSGLLLLLGGSLLALRRKRK